jgi:clan AA aspartic protease (TIGR02281 family)
VASALIALAFPPQPVHAANKCEMRKVAELPIDMRGSQPTLAVKINGKDARFLLDSGAFYSMISAATADEYGLKTASGFMNLKVKGIGGTQDARTTRVQQFSIGNIVLNDAQFMVAGSEVGSGLSGILGQNMLKNFEVEYDLGHGIVRLFQSKNCDNIVLAYWLAPNEDYSKVPILSLAESGAHTVGYALINGKKIAVMFDSGAGTSIVSSQAAENAGVKLNSDAVVPAGFSRGIGQGFMQTYIGRFSSFKIGDGEEIKSAKLRIGKGNLGGEDMLIGADFFMSHRIFVGNNEHVLYLSYTGGPVFDLSKHSDTEAHAGPEDGAAKPTTPEGDQDAADLARRGSALVSRRDFAAGLPLLSKAVAISPSEPEYLYQRGNAYSANGQNDLALADFDQVIKLKQDFLPAYLPKAALLLAKGDKSAAIAQLDAVASLAPKAADLRFSLGLEYQRVDHFTESIQQFNLWIDEHAVDSRKLTAYSGRCLSRALGNQELPQGLSDCDSAMLHASKTLPENSEVWAHRAVIRLRMGDYAKAMSDCNYALKMMPKNATALYVRGVVESKTAKKAESDADLAAAEKIAPKLRERMSRMGIAPL